MTAGAPAGARREQWLERLRQRPAGRPVEQRCGMHDGNPGAGGDLGDAADVAGGDQIGAHALDVRDLAVAQPGRDHGLQQVVGAGRAAAEMPFGHVLHGEARLAQELLRLEPDLLAVLHRAGRMIGDHQVGVAHRRLQADLGHQLGDVASDRADPGGLGGVGRVLAQHEPVVLDRGAAARGVDHHRIEAGALELAPPGVDVGPSGAQRRALLAHVMGERAAAAGPLGDDHLDAVPGEQTDGGLVDLRRQDLLGAAAEQRDARAPGPLGREHLRPVDRRGCGDAGRREREHDLETPGQPARHGPAEPGAEQGEAEQEGPRQHARQRAAQQPVGQRPAYRSPRCAGGRGPPGACSGRPRGRWSCRRGRTGSGRCA